MTQIKGVEGRVSLFLACMFAVGLGVAYGAASEERAKPVRRAVETSQADVYRTVTDGSEDSKVRTTPLDPQATGGDPTLVVSARSVTPLATVQLQVDRYQLLPAGRKKLGIARITTATITYDSGEGATLFAEDVFFDITGADEYDLLAVDISTGATISLLAHTGGSAGKVAE